MRKTTLIPAVADEAPNSSTLTTYDEEKLLTYLRLLDAEAEGAEWDEAALLVLQIDPVQEPVRARRIWESHLARAKWLAEHGHRHLLYDGMANWNSKACVLTTRASFTIVRTSDSGPLTHPHDP
jgi:hypothetical protein